MAKPYVFPPESAMKQYRPIFEWVWKHFEFPEGEPRAYFLAQIDHESKGMTVLKENLNYSVSALRNTFVKWGRMSMDDATRLGRIGTVRTPAQKANQEAIANIVYGGPWGWENLGNRNEGDGWWFRGRGPIQITGRAMYQGFHDYCQEKKLTRKRGDVHVVIDVMNDPDVVATPEVGLLAAGWFWDYKKVNSLIRNDMLTTMEEIERVTKRVNGGKMGLLERRVRTLEYMDPNNPFWT